MGGLLPVSCRVVSWDPCLGFPTIAEAISLDQWQRAAANVLARRSPAEPKMVDVQAA
ncbi:hypothetical protein [Methylobacterium radiodurans]|uniref:hypothetical protein n=1 Tax=Methylobacterium radiodurans TaxID=2202828 RepID=UPI0013A52BB4|nr:hypothetical protein [Methylobacterium radiodurans]